MIELTLSLVPITHKSKAMVKSLSLTANQTNTVLSRQDGNEHQQQVAARCRSETEPKLTDRGVGPREFRQTWLRAFPLGSPKYGPLS